MSKQAKETSNQDDKEEGPLPITDYVRDVSFYQGLIPRSDIEPLLKKDGDFLLRKTEHTPGTIILALSVRYEDSIKHFIVNQNPEGLFYFESHCEKTVAQLIEWHKSTKTPLSATSPAKLLRPIERPVSRYSVKTHFFSGVAIKSR
jgi:hypothetical protein